MNYSLTVTNETTETPVVDVQVGSAALVSYAEKDARDVLRAGGGNRFSVELRQLDSDGEPSGDALLDLTADGKTVADVLKVRLAAARKSERGSEAGEQNTETAES